MIESTNNSLQHLSCYIHIIVMAPSRYLLLLLLLKLCLSAGDTGVRVMLAPAAVRCCSESTYRTPLCTRPERRSRAPAAARLSAPAVCRAAGRPAAGHCSPCVYGASDQPAADAPAHRAAVLGPADTVRHTSESSSAHDRTVHQSELYLRVLLSPQRVASSETSSLQLLLPVTSLLLLQILQTLHLQRCGLLSAPLRHNSHESELVFPSRCVRVRLQCVHALFLAFAMRIRCTNSSTDRLQTHLHLLLCNMWK